VSARSRLDRVDELVTQAADLALTPDDVDYEPSVERLARLLEALVAATVAATEATLEAAGRAVDVEHRQITRHHVADGLAGCG
jgi:hypothetical protein